MPREVSRRTSKPPEMKGKVSRPDMVRTLPVPNVQPIVDALDKARQEIEEISGVAAIRRGKDMDHYVGSINPTDGKSKGATGYVDNND